MSDLILSLSHYHRHIAIYVIQIIDTMLGYVSFTGFAYGPNRLYFAKTGTLHY